MKRTVQIYVADADNVLQRLDLFKDETISLTDTIQDVRDIAKVFTEFTQSFTVPASKTNNKVFRHFYNADISDGYDARLLHNARIEINSILFKKGFVTLEGVDMKDNKPNAYRITFYGETVTLKDIIGDDELGELNFPESLNESYNSTTVKSKLSADPSSNDIIAPLITHTQRLYYDSGDNDKDTGNISNHNQGSGNKHGLRWDNIKYAIRLHRIIEQIESKYSEITFSEDFFTTTNPHYYDLFVWMHRNKGYIERDKTTATVSGWSTPNTQEVTEMSDSSTLKILTDDISSIEDFDLTLTRTGVDGYDLTVLRNDEEIYTEIGITTTSKYIDFTSEVQSINDEFKVQITSENSISFSVVKWTLDYREPGEQGSIDTHTTSYNFSSDFKFDVNAQMPKMKVIDFLTGLFKMFNLTALVESDGTIYVDTLDEFYVDKESNGSPYNIDEFVDSNSNTVDKALPYRNIKFTYEDLGTLLATQHEQIKIGGQGGFKWGEEDFVRTNLGGQVFSGEIYEVVVPFQHMKFERLFDDDDNTKTLIQWGYSADDNFNQDTGDYDSYIGKPLLFYPINVTLDSNNEVSLITSIDPSDNVTFLAHDQITTSINVPSNSRSLIPSGTDNKRNINFKNERNEYNVGEDDALDFTDTLFEQFYSSYITQVFAKSNRITKIKAYLPLRILLNYTLADKFIYKGRKHQINSITTNLTTGESEIELLNIVIE